MNRGYYTCSKMLVWYQTSDGEGPGEDPMLPRNDHGEFERKTRPLCPRKIGPAPYGRSVGPALCDNAIKLSQQPIIMCGCNDLSSVISAEHVEDAAGSDRNPDPSLAYREMAQKQAKRVESSDRRSTCLDCGSHERDSFSFPTLMATSLAIGDVRSRKGAINRNCICLLNKGSMRRMDLEPRRGVLCRWSGKPPTQRYVVPENDSSRQNDRLLG